MDDDDLKMNVDATIDHIVAVDDDSVALELEKLLLVQTDNGPKVGDPDYTQQVQENRKARQDASPSD